MTRRRLHGGHGPGAPKLASEINVTPFIDVMLVLLIVFMITAPLMMSGIPLSLPKAEAMAMTMEPTKEPLVVSLDKDGRIFVGEETVEEKQLPAKLSLAVAADPNRVVYVRCDKELQYGRIMELLDQVGAGGVSSLSLVAENKAGSGDPEGIKP